MTTPAPPRAKVNPLVKLALEMGPLGLFFAATWRPGLFHFLLAFLLLAPLPPSMFEGPQGAIYTATAVFMAAMAVSLVITWILYRRLPIMPVVSGVVVLVFGGLTLFLENELFIKLKPTVVNCLFGGVLLGGLAAGKSLLPYVLDSFVALDEAGWRKLTFRWGLFFFFLAILNEVVWRTQTTETWVAFKVFGTMPITLVFALAQTPLVLRHALPEPAAERQESRL